MRILGAIGLALAIIFIRSLMPEIFHAFEKTLLMFFDTLQMALSIGQHAVSNVSTLVQ